MPLIQRLSGPHTVREFRQAALQRYREATRLALGGDRLAAIYLAGYAAEMLLKAAWFRLAGKAQAAPITVAEIQQAKSYAVTALGVSWPGNLHDLTRWAAALVEERKRRGVALSVRFARAVTSRADRIYVNWRETLRYRANRPYQGEVAVTLDSVQWLIVQYRYL